MHRVECVATGLGMGSKTNAIVRSVCKRNRRGEERKENLGNAKPLRYLPEIGRVRGGHGKWDMGHGT